MKSKLSVLGVAFILFLVLGWEGVYAQEPYPITVIDQTPTQPLTNPTPSGFQPRYISGFGQDEAFTVFFEDRDNSGRISFNRTTTGPLGFSTISTLTNIIDTHFVVKDWPVVISNTTYAYRGWGAEGNNPQHNFYVSDNLITWTHVSTFTIANSAAFTNARGFVYYGFHDVIPLNGTYYAFGESNGGQTMLVSSTTGTDDWIAFASVGGSDAADGPLQLPESGTPTGNFLPLAQDRGYGKLHVRGNDSGFYLAINTAAKPSLSDAALEAAFIDPANWTWHDGSTGLTSAMVYTATAEHDLRELWAVPQSDPDADWTVIYDADYGSTDGGKALGYMGVVPSRPVDHFEVRPIDMQIATHPFSITVTAYDAYGYRVSYTGTVTLHDSTGTLSPTVSGDFDSTGALTQTVVISTSGVNVVITATHPTTPSIVGQSDAFEVQALRVTNLDTGERFWTIQEAIDDAETLAGHTISITAGIYTETLTLHKAVRLIGAGSGPAGTVIAQTQAGAGDSKIGVVQIVTSGLSSAAPLLLQDLRIEPHHLAGISVGRFTEATGEDIAYVKLANVKVIGTNTNPSSEQERGLYVDLTSSLRHLVVEDSAFDNLTYGWYFQKEVSADTSTVQHITVTNTSFSHNNLKGIYAEKLSDATFTACTVTDNGFSADGVPPYFQPWMAGIDLNLKAGAYQNLTFTDCTVTDNALGGAAHGVGLTVKARDDGGYATHPATLTHVLIDGGVFRGNERGIRLGEPDKDNAGSPDVQIHYATIVSNTAVYTGSDGSATGDLINYTGANVDATLNDWGVHDLAAIETHIYHYAEDGDVGDVIYYTISVTSDKASVMLDGVSTARVTATLGGLLAPAGHVISFTTNLGTLSRITGTTDADGRVTLVFTPTADGTALITGTAGMAGDYPRHVTASITVLPLTLHHFRVYLLQDQVAGQRFPVAISARDTEDTVITAFNGRAWLTDTTGTVWPSGPIIFDQGVWNDFVTVTQAVAADTITVTYQSDAQKFGQSIPFTVTHADAVTATLTPASAAVTAGQSLTYTVWATDTFGNMWDATAEARYTIASEAGGMWRGAHYTAHYAGVWPVTATVDTAVTTATLIVPHGPATVLTLVPDPLTITAGDPATYTVTAEDGYGNTWDVTSTATYTHPDEADGYWTDNVYNSQTPGTWPITAKVDALQDTGTLHVITATVAALHLNPMTATVYAGQTITYTVSATDTAGNTWDATPGTYFAIDSLAGGAWDNAGAYTAARAGAWRVTAIYGGHVITGTLVVQHSAPTMLDVTPQRHAVTAGAPVAYTITAIDAWGNIWNATDAVAFVAPDAVQGTWAAPYYTPTRAGAWPITITLGTAQAAATLTVTHSAATHLTLTPTSATLPAGSPISYTVWAQDTFGNGWDATADAAYAIAPEAGGTWQEPHAQARYTAQYAGTWPVTATVGTTTATATLMVTHGDAEALTLRPDPLTITAGETVTYTVTAHDAYGNVWDITSSALFRHTSGAGGRWMANTYTGQTPGTWAILALVDELHDTATLHVITASIASLAISPMTATVAAGQAMAYTVLATDAAGNTWDVTHGTHFISESGAEGSWKGNVYTSVIAGSWPIYASYGGHVATALLTVTPGIATEVTVTPQASTITAGTSLTYKVIANDTHGNAWDVTSDAAYALPSSAGGTWLGAIYTSQVAGPWTVTATVGQAMDTASLIVTPGPASTVALAPVSATITTDQRVTYTVWATDAYNNAWAATTEAKYTITPEAGGIWAKNIYYAEHAGMWTVTATVGTHYETAQLRVVAPTIPTPTYTLTINIRGEGTVIRQPESQIYPQGQVVTLTSVPEDGWQFEHWRGGIASGFTSLQNPITLTMKSDTIIAVKFVRQKPVYKLLLPIVTKGYDPLSSGTSR